MGGGSAPVSLTVLRLYDGEADDQTPQREPSASQLKQIREKTARQSVTVSPKQEGTEEKRTSWNACMGSLTRGKEKGRKGGIGVQLGK